MDKVFKFILDGRRAFIKLIQELSLEQLNEIPFGFNNNIIWNFGHIVVSTQTLSYTRTGIREDVNWVKYVNAYAKGTKPSYVVSQEEVDDLIQIAISSIHDIETDYNAGIFKNTTPFSTHTYGVTLETIEEVLNTSVGHDNFHFGYALAQKRIINNK